MICFSFPIQCSPLVEYYRTITHAAVLGVALVTHAALLGVNKGAKIYLQVQVMGYCSSVPPAWKHPGRYYPPMVVEGCFISLQCLGLRSVCRLKFWHMGQWIVLYNCQGLQEKWCKAEQDPLLNSPLIGPDDWLLATDDVVSTRPMVSALECLA